MENLFIKKNENTDEVIRVCLLPPQMNESKTQYIEKIYSYLTRLGGSEKEIVNHLAYKLWPNNLTRSLDLSRNQTILELKRHTEVIVQLDLIKKTKKKMVCSNCKLQGHLEKDCRKKN